MAAFLTRNFELGLTWLTADDLGTPTLATNRAARTIWSGGFEPFGADWLAGTSAGTSENGVFLRLPGQWEDPVWIDATLGAGLYYNVHRWYEPATGKYSRPDPLGYEGSPLNWYLYAEANPLLFVDLLGLTSYMDFPPGKREEIEKAVEKAKKELEGSCCAGNATKPILRQLEQATIVYRPKLDVCGQVTPWGKLTDRIQTGESAFSFAQCCLLESTVAHEANHLRWNSSGDDASYQIEKKCFGCGR